MLADQGHKLTVVCATNGDVGEISDPALATPENLAEVRQREMWGAMEVTRIHDVRFLGYRDSGMQGTSDNDNPDCLMRARPETVVGQIRAILAELSPDLVLTHDPTGGYGHPDHIATYRHTTAAVEAQSYGDQLRPLLYYVCYPKGVFRQLWQEMKNAGVEPPFANDDEDTIGSPDEDVTTVMDVARFVHTKKESLSRHRTQMDPNGAFHQLPEDIMNRFMSTEYFWLVQFSGDDKQHDILADLR